MTDMEKRFRQGGMSPSAQEQKSPAFGGQSNFKEFYEVAKPIGNGAFSVVHKCRNRKTKELMAVKVIDKQSVDRRLAALHNEIYIMQHVSHPNVLNLTELFEDEKHLYLVMPLMLGGELFDRILNVFPSGYSERQAAAIIRNILEGVRYLHANGIIHRDLKPENILLASVEANATDIRIADFGFAKVWTAEMQIRTACGSPNYVAPEVLLREMNGYTAAADLWSVGVVSYVLLCGFCPFYDERPPRLYRMIITGDYSFPSPYWDGVSDPAKSFVRSLLVTDPTRRATAEQALSHPWIAGNTQPDVKLDNITETLACFRDVQQSMQSQRDAFETVVRQSKAQDAPPSTTTSAAAATAAPREK